MNTKMPGVVRLPCACANLRRAARVVTQFYDAALGPSGLPVTQFTLLQALRLAPGISQKQLAELLGIDSSTLTRTLVPLRRNGMAAIRGGRRPAGGKAFGDGGG